MPESVRFLRRWLLLLILAPISAGMAGYFVVSRIPSVYEATVTLLVQPGDTSNGTPDPRVAQDLAQTYAEAIHTRRILSDAAMRVGLGALPEREVEDRVQVRRVSSTQLLRISAQDTDPSRAAELANAVAQVFVTQNADTQASRYATSRDNLGRLVEQLQADIDTRLATITDVQAQPASPERDALLAQLENNLTQIRTTYGNYVKSYEDLRVSEARTSNSVTVFDGAVPPESPSRPNRILTTLLAALAGLVAACGLAVLAEHLDDRLHNAERIAASTGLSTLGVVPARRSAGSLRDQAASGSVQSYRVLRTRLRFVLREQAPRTLLIASATAGEGKSTIAANLAVALAEGGAQAILVDADIHRPAQMRLFELPNDTGLSDLLMDDSESIPAALNVTPLPTLRVLTAGSMSPEPSALLSSRRLPAVIEKLRSLCDLLIIDTPPLLSQPDGVLLSQHADAVLFVIDAQRTHARMAASALEMLRGSGANVIGAVLNRASKDTVDFAPYGSSGVVRSAALEMLRGSGANVIGAVLNRASKDMVDFAPYGSPGVVRSASKGPPDGRDLMTEEPSAGDGPPAAVARPANLVEG